MPKAIAQVPARSDVKGALLRAAAELIAEVGWGKVSSRMVAERAGVNNALVHYHFASMDDLLRRAAEQVLEQVFAAPTREVWRDGDVREGMRRALRWLDRLDVDSMEALLLVEGLVQARRDPDLQRHMAAALSELRAELTRALADADGAPGEAPPEGVATLLLALLDGLLLHRIVDPALRLTLANRALQVLLTASEPRGAGR